MKLQATAALLIAEFKYTQEAELIAKLIGTMSKAKVLQKGRNLEDMYFAELIKAGMKEKGFVTLNTFKRELRSRIKSLSTAPSRRTE